MKSFKFTDSKIRNIDLPSSGRDEYSDTEIKQLRLRVSSGGVKSFSLFAWNQHQKKMQRVQIASFGDISVDMARQIARKALADIISGVDINAKRRDSKARQLTLEQLFHEYVDMRGSDLKQSTANRYKSHMRCELKHLVNIPITDITTNELKKLYHKKRSGGGYVKITKNFNGLRLVRALFNMAIEKKYVAESPIDNSFKFHHPEPRTRIIEPDSLHAFFKALNNLSDTTAKAYFGMLIFTGCRSSEALKMLTVDVSIKKYRAVARDTKNRKDFTLHFPVALMSYIKAIYNPDNKYLFESKTVKNIPISVPRAATRSITRDSGIKFSSHDLRRSFATYAEICGVPHSIITKLLNHSTKGSVTFGYIQTQERQIIEAIGQIADYISDNAGLVNSASIQY